ncbi:MAG: PQQ-dependent sugar dehydrogenase [Saprospiraceae bacterium]
MNKFLILSFFLLSSDFGFCQPSVSFTKIGNFGQLDDITDITGARDGSGRLFIVEQRGTIRIVNDLGSNNYSLETNFFLDIQSLVTFSGERGLLGMAFHPQYPDSPYVYVNYVRSGSGHTRKNRISRFTLNPNDANDLLESSRRDIIEILGNDGDNHKAGDLAFGPDGYLYFGTGDGGGGNDPSNNGQNLDVLLGKILRLDIDAAATYDIPPDNPFVGQNGLDEIWMYGMRNPWRLSFDRSNGNLWIADVGQGMWEEVDMIPAGEGAGWNMGWDCREGAHDFLTPPNYCIGQTFVDPVFEYDHSLGASISGGFVYRGTNPDFSWFRGHYIAVDYVSERVFIVKQIGSSFASHHHAGIITNGGVTTFGENDNGELFAGNQSGDIFSLGFTGGTLPINWDNVKVDRTALGNKVQWTLHTNLEVDLFEVQRATKADFSDAAKLAQIKSNPEKISYFYNDQFDLSESVYYRIAAMMKDGSIEYSPIVRVLSDKEPKPMLVFDFNANMWRVNIPKKWQNSELTLHDVQGKLVFSQKLSDNEHYDLTSPVASCVYFITIRNEDQTWSDKIVK